MKEAKREGGGERGYEYDARDSALQYDKSDRSRFRNSAVYADGELDAFNGEAQSIAAAAAAAKAAAAAAAAAVPAIAYAPVSANLAPRADSGAGSDAWKLVLTCGMNRSGACILRCAV